jgi:hypothetical protein
VELLVKKYSLLKKSRFSKSEAMHAKIDQFTQILKFVFDIESRATILSFVPKKGTKRQHEIRKLLKLPDVPAEDQLATIQLVYKNMKRKSKQRKDRAKAMNMKFKTGDLRLL